jgi:hypothetical protein
MILSSSIQIDGDRTINPLCTSTSQSTLSTASFAPGSPSKKSVSTIGSPVKKRGRRRFFWANHPSPACPGSGEEEMHQLDESFVEVICPDSYTSKGSHPSRSRSRSPMEPLHHAPTTSSPTTSSPTTSMIEVLKGLTVEILIDQESFRDASPSFKFVGYSTNKEMVDDSGTIVRTGVANFMPVKRKVYPFHWAPIDSGPVLRRIMINGDDTRDYISREANLQIKHNGVYSVHGSETVMRIPDSEDKENSQEHKLLWKFDFLVDDKNRNSLFGLPGDRLLRPLTFSCSPMLLHRSQMKKVKMMHFIRKSLMSKRIASEKLEPGTWLHPVAPASRKPLTSAGVRANSNAKINTQDPAKASVKRKLFSVHRRAHSHSASVAWSMEAVEKEDNSCMPVVSSAVTRQSVTLRRRRASSVEGMAVKDPLQFVPPSHVKLPQVRRILSPSKLHQMMLELEGAADVSGTSPPTFGNPLIR